VIRAAGPQDAERLAALLHDFQTEFDDVTPGPEVLAGRVRAAIERGEAHFVLAPDGLALVSLRDTILYGRVALLEELYVAPPARGRGQGRALLEHAMRLAREQGAASMEIVTSTGDEAARGLYASAGFTNLDGADQLLYYEREL